MIEYPYFVPRLNDNNPEKVAIIHDKLEKLNVEAKFLLYVIFNSPNELSELAKILFGKKSTAKTKELQIWRTDKKQTENKQLVQKYLKKLSRQIPQKKIFMCDKCTNTFKEAGVPCPCGGISKEETTGWRSIEINKTLFAVKEFVKEIERI